MTQELQPVVSPARSGPRRWWLLLGGGVIVIALVAALGFRFWPRQQLPEPPLPDLTGVDPEVAAFVRKTREEVLHKPSSSHAWGRLGMVYLANGFDALADEPLEIAQRLDPHDARWPYLRGTPLLHINPDAGIALLKRAVELCGDKPLVPRLRLAEALLENGQLDEAETNLDTALHREPGNRRAQIGLARLALLRQDWKTALSRLEPLLDDPSTRKQARIMRAQVWIHLGQPDRARQDQQQAAALPPDKDWPDPYVDHVLSLARGLRPRLGSVDILADRDPPESLRAVQQLVADYPDSVEVWVRLAEVRRRSGDERGAEQALERAVQIDPQASEAWFRLGGLRLTTRPRDAADCFRRAIQIKPDLALAHYNLGLCLEKLGDRAGAADEFRATLRCRPDYNQAQVALQRLSAKTSEKKSPARK